MKKFMNDKLSYNKIKKIKLYILFKIYNIYIFQKKLTLKKRRYITINYL